ncbi:hypothetical protein [Spiroplasma endosymbiont of Dilophus febrilis]|uniref:MurR/RpiR family transcriptional regulator n=1 Tax=Spiroplasma endosymbiont of Dilophus febrilis TaxID=3066292 RepID=UPI00313DDB5A
MTNIILVVQQYSQENEQSIDQLISQTILNNINDFANINLTLLAKQAYTSTASIIRFCKKLGYSGYSEFKFAFLQAYKKKNPTEDASLKNCFSCNNFWKGIKHNNFLISELNQEIVANYLLKQHKVYLLVDKVISTNLKPFIKKLNRLFYKIDFCLFNANDYFAVNKEKSLVLVFANNLPNWFSKTEHLFVQFFSPIFDLKNASLQAKNEYVLLVLIKLFAIIYSK